jgi:hypothetical protein
LVISRRKTTKEHRAMIYETRTFWVPVSELTDADGIYIENVDNRASAYWKGNLVTIQKRNGNRVLVIIQE